VTENRVRFETDVPGIWGLWPTTPTLWSYSSLKEIEACPRRWMLSRADYPDIWERPGSPPLPVVAAIFGNVVHSVVERLIKELAAAGITSPNVGDVVGVLGSLGGWRRIVLDAIDRELQRLDGNPRISPERVDRLRDELLRRAPEAADQVKAFLGRGALPAPQSSGCHLEAKEAETPRQRSPAGPGAHAEREVTADALRLTGRIDLLIVGDDDVAVTDFKTGQEGDAHDDQVRLYALLWHLDGETNPDGRPATKLRVAYPSYERTVDAPDTGQLQSLESATAARIEAADAITQNPPPTATPSEETCQYCHVKHLCDAYWPAVPPAISGVSTEQWFDFEGRVLRPNGSRSWFVETLAEPAAEVLVRTVETDVAFPVGKRVRLLGVRRSQDPDKPERLVISMVGTSEWYTVSS
jgi:hypothetical protein